MKNFISDLWLGKIPLAKTWWQLVIFILIYFFFIHYLIPYKRFLDIESLGFYMFVDILGVVLSFFILASVWRAADKDKVNIMWRNLSKISTIVIVAYSIYQAYIKWIIQD
tara:strand:+ start:192 stop:521 length:330 start_codon:yes stop_codon:yes gene_type:complete